MHPDMKELLTSLANEVDVEKANKLTPEQKRLHELCRKLLLLERDLRAPGVARTPDDRAARLMEELAKEKI